MSFLDARAAREDDPQMVALHEVLIRAYADKVDALSIAGSVGILQADIVVPPKGDRHVHTIHPHPPRLR